MFYKSENSQAKLSRMITVFGLCLIIAVFAGGIFLDLSRRADAEEPVVEPEIVETPAPTPVPTPVPTPTVDGIKLYAFGRELDADGFTTYVGDKPFTIFAEPYPAVAHPVITWSIGDSASLSVSSDGLSCDFTAVKPSGKNELTVRCHGAEIVIPVYLWER